MRAAIYARISKDREGTEVGVTNQTEASEALAADLGATVIKVYTDNDTGASRRSKKPRPGFAALMEDAKAGAFDLIIAYSMSRLTRRPMEWVELIDVAEKKKIQFRFKVSPSFDLSTADGRASAMTVAVWDAAEAERTGERIQFQRQATLAKGIDTPSVRPFGYEPGAKKLRKEEAEALQWAYQAVLEGKSLYAIAQEFTARGLKRDRAANNAWRSQTIRAMLLRERNRGHLVVKGVLYSTDVLPLIGSDTFEAVKAILTDPARAPKRGTKPYVQYFTGHLRCGVCGNYMRLGTNSGVQFLTCAQDGRPVATIGQKHSNIRLHLADKIIRKEVQILLFALGAVKHDFSAAEDTKKISLELAELRRQRDLAQELMFEPGANVPLLKAKIAKLGLEIDKLQQDFDQAISANIGGVALDAAWSHITASEATDEAWTAYWESLSVEHKATLLKALMPNARVQLASTPGSRITYDKLAVLQDTNPSSLLAGMAEKVTSTEKES